MENFVEALEKNAQEMYKKTLKPLFRDALLQKPHIGQFCWICESRFEIFRQVEGGKIVHLCHYSGKIPGFAHPE